MITVHYIDGRVEDRTKFEEAFQQAKDDRDICEISFITSTEEAISLRRNYKGNFELVTEN